ncbi:MAG: tryptophan 2,3-dioxygenase family protein [Acidobacteriota bacterium]|nr:tryptophan 2,3-dioxygenase family protein [Blastocatellia bacterium]MDW8413653.1 tryptophan 2,3-dioxygenase family protein [Acidobacteriota bacterium]
MEHQLSYNEYLAVAELLRLQRPKSNPPHHDEMLFIIIHQTYELWFKLILHEFDAVKEDLCRDDWFTAERRLWRVVEIQRVLVSQIHILETMPPVNFLAFRDLLKPASGFQSSQFREMEFLLGLKDRRVLGCFNDDLQAKAQLERRLEESTLADEFYKAMARRGFQVAPPPQRSSFEWQSWLERTVSELVKLYVEEPADDAVYRVAERLIEVDENLSLWRYHHMKIVERIIGSRIGTGGSEGVGYLKHTLGYKAFPELWEVRSRIEFS